MAERIPLAQYAWQLWSAAAAFRSVEQHAQNAGCISLVQLANYAPPQIARRARGILGVGPRNGVRQIPGGAA